MLQPVKIANFLDIDNLIQICLPRSSLITECFEKTFLRNHVLNCASFYFGLFQLCFFLNLNIPSYPEAPDFRVKRNSAVVVENADSKRLARKVEDQRRRMAEGDLPTLEELNELPSGFYPRKLCFQNVDLS